MDAWTIILMLGAMAIWLSLGGAVLYLIQRPHGAASSRPDR